ncbi:MAG: TetR/AcrR family transcriptional regulator [Chloroflexi bacterium]|nr:TetR/AcrR family transcriptional regulator [Chloroflexota bacterium]
MMEKQDRRVRKTQRALSDALVELILEKGYDTITIKDITDRADVAHATFYRHYGDKDELLRRKLEEIVGEIEALTREPTLKNSEGYLIFKHAQENSNLYRILLGGQEPFRYVNGLKIGWRQTHCGRANRSLTSRTALFRQKLLPTRLRVHCFC